MTLLYLILLLHTTASLQYCPCDHDPFQCELNCCCDTNCNAEQASSFTCQPFLMSDSMLCCKDIVKAVNGAYQNVRECSSNLGCLEESPAGYGLFSNNSDSESLVFSDDLESVDSTFSYTQSSQYKDTDLLLQRTSDSSPVEAFQFPVQYFGDQCAMSPILFYSEISSTCKRTISDMNTVCAPNQILDSQYYLGSLMKFPNDTSETIDLSENIVYYCLDYDKGVKEVCTPDSTSPGIVSGECLNAVKDVHIRLKTASDAMTIESATVTITLTSLPSSETSSFTQTFTLTYTPVSTATAMSGNFGYQPRSPLLSGRISDGSVMMSGDASLRPLTLFKSSDCSTFSEHNIEFGIAHFTGCKLSLPFYSFQVMSGSQERYCSVLYSYAESVMKIPDGIVVGETGRASISDVTQWVTIETEDDVTISTSSESSVACSDIITHRKYTVWYTEIGQVGNLHAVITKVSVQYTKQKVELYCNSNTCSTNKQQYLTLSNSVQFVLNAPHVDSRFKSFPRTALILPVDFFYPLTSGVGGRWAGFSWVVTGFFWVWHSVWQS